MAQDGTKDYFNVFKVGELTRAQNGNLQEFTRTELKENVDFKTGEKLEAEKIIYYSDGSDALANRGFVVTFQHVPSGEYVHFKAFINAFNETFSCDWNSETVYGRTDPIKMFKQTTRRITLSIIVPAASEAEGFENLSKVQSLTSFLYPSYADTNNALTISQSPLIRLRLMNLLRKTQNQAEDFEKHNYKDNTFSVLKGGMNNLSKESADGGLLGTINNLSVSHNIDNVDMGSFFIGEGVIIPKGIELTLDFDVIHERVLGWKQNSDDLDTQTFSDKQFPYGLDYEGSEPLTAAQIAKMQAEFAGLEIDEVVAQRDADNARTLSEQQRQNAIAAGHLVASEVVNGQQQFKLSKKGENARDTIKDRRLKGTKFNPFTPRPFPEDQLAEAEAYENFLNEWVD